MNQVFRIIQFEPKTTSNRYLRTLKIQILTKLITTKVSLNKYAKQSRVGQEAKCL